MFNEELESYTHQSADDGSEMDNELYCGGYGDLADGGFCTDDMVNLCEPCYDLCKEESEGEE